MSIQVSQVSKLYGEQKALNEVSFEINKGEIVGFLGPNGAGKSTMMKILTGYISQSKGEAKVCGLDVTDKPEEVKRKIGYLPEHNPLYLEMYVKEYLEFVCRIYGLKNKKERIAQIIEEVGLTVEQSKKIGALSKGYRQRVGLAQALIHDPEVLILDEPTTGLDPNQLVEIRELIKRVGANKTVMLSTHIMQEVEAICDKVIIIRKGEIVANDEVKNLVNEQSADAVLLLELEQKLDQKLIKAIAGVVNVKAVDDKTFVIAHKSKSDPRKALMQLALDNDNHIQSLQKKEKNLEEVFKELTNN